MTLLNAIDVISFFRMASVTFGTFGAGIYPIGFHTPSKAFTTMAFSSRLFTGSGLRDKGGTFHCYYFSKLLPFIVIMFYELWFWITILLSIRVICVTNVSI